ncbi:MAG: hypothetical protein Q8L98_04560 [Chlamydiales bacterium]|nr:hypothetical protein [Chlamydiales bacterium]
MSGNTQVYQTTTPPTTSGGVLGSGYSALCAAAMGTSLVNLYQMLNIQNKLKALNIQNIQNEAEAQSIATIEAGKKERMGSFIQAGSQLSQTASGLYTAGKGLQSEMNYQNKMGGIKDKGDNLKLLAGQINEKPISVDQNIIDRAVLRDPDNLETALSADERLLVKNHATDWQQEMLKQKIVQDPNQAADLGDLLKPSNKQDFEAMLTGKLDPKDIDQIQRELSPIQRKSVVKQASQFEKQELPEQKVIIRDNSTETTKQNMWSQQIFRPLAEATGQAGHGIYTAEAAKDRASGQLAGAAEQMARDANQTVGSTLDMITRVIEALMSAQATMAQKTA